MHEYDGRTDLWKAAIKRKADAMRLFEAGKSHYAGSMYLAGYAIECRMKAIMMDAYGVLTLKDLGGRMSLDERDVFTHGLEAMVETAPFGESLRRSPVWRDFAKHVTLWKPSWRYDPRERTEREARDFLDAVDRVFRWLDTNRC